MSRIGKKIIEVPEGVDITITTESIVVKGPKGQLEQVIHPNITVKQEDNTIKVTVEDPSEKKNNALWGLFGSLITNMIVGVKTPYQKQLEVNGVGYKVALSGKKLTLNLGYSHPIDFEIPETVDVVVEKNVITLTSINKQLVGQVAADIRKLRKPEPYKGKGIKYMEEVIRRKAGKTASA